MRTKALALLALLLVSVTSAEPKYEFIDLGGNFGRAFSINDNGEIVGYASYRATLFDPTGSGNNINLGTLPGGSNSYAHSINNNGQIVGYAWNASKRYRATLFDSTGGGNNIDLGTLGGSESLIHSINNNGQIVGWASIPSNKPRATLFDSTGSGNNINLGTLGGDRSAACSINNNGQIVGMAHNVSGEPRATLFDPTGSGNNIDLGTLPGGGESLARSINNNGQIVGQADNVAGQVRATFFDSTGSGNNIDLGTIPGGGESYARSINNNGQIVGQIFVKNQYKAILFDSTGSGNNIDLNTLIDPNIAWTLTHAFGINDNGWIVGGGRNPAGQQRAFLLIPKPSTPPVADADGPYSIYIGDTLTLDANDSTDEDDDIVSYMWDLDDDGSFETDAGGQAIFDVNYAYLQSLGLLVDHIHNIHVKVTDSQGQSDVASTTLTIVPKPATVVAVDIKPGSCPNPVNVKSKGVLPIAILGTDDYDVTTIDIASIRLAGVEPLRSGYEDVATPVSDNNDCNCITEGPDGLLDLTLKFETRRIVNAIGDVNHGDVLTLQLTGVLYDTIPYETLIEGADCILIRGRHKPINPADINKDGVVNAADFAIFAQNWLQSSIIDE